LPRPRARRLLAAAGEEAWRWQEAGRGGVGGRPAARRGEAEAGRRREVETQVEAADGGRRRREQRWSRRPRPAAAGEGAAPVEEEAAGGRRKSRARGGGGGGAGSRGGGARKTDLGRRWGQEWRMDKRR